MGSESSARVFTLALDSDPVTLALDSDPIHPSDPIYPDPIHPRNAPIMNKTSLAKSLITLSLICSGIQAAHADNPADIDAAKSAIKQLAGTLQSELKTAMQTGGPVAAIGICNTRAIPITEKVAEQQGMHVSRVSLRNRNPANAPIGWQAAVLEGFQQQKSDGKDVTMLTWSETVDVNGSREFRFMKAIPTGEVCLACHGTMLTPEVSSVLAELYPQDRATGFSVGDIRGAFLVTRVLD